MDEINIALHYNLLSPTQVIEALEERDPKVEVILTGRYAPEIIIDKADLVTEMKEIKHYYTDGVKARDGIER
jgi:cob(I)alamin adenosyltransferase